MTETERQELYDAIYSKGEVYRPPSEEHSTLLEVASGCSWAKCAFCDFTKDAFITFSMEQIVFSLKVLRQLEPQSKRLFFLGQNAFCLPAETLLAIMQGTRRYMPAVKEFSMYSRPDDVLRKSPEELLLLRKQGVRTLHIGLESGSDPILSLVNKGCTAADIRKALGMLDCAGIEYFLTIVLGLGGKAYRNLHALETARLLNQTHPVQIWALALKLWPGTELARLVRRGDFEPMSPREILLEERILLSNLTLSDTFYLDTTVLNSYTIQGRLPEQKPAMLAAIERFLAQ